MVDEPWYSPVRVTARRLANFPPYTGADAIVNVAGSSTRVRVLGRGEPPVVILPDPPNVVDHYEMLLKRLAQHRRVICFDFPGFGFSRPPRGYAFGIEDTADLLGRTLDRLGVYHATVSCSCIGAHAVLYMAEQRPELVDRLILLQFQAFAAAQTWVKAVSMHGIVTAPWVGQIFVGAFGATVVRRWYESSLPAGEPREPYVKEAIEALRSGASFPLASAFQSFVRSCGRPMSRSVDTTIVWGRGDPCHVRSDPRSGLSCLPHARFIEWPGVGHFPDLERPDSFMDLVLA